MTTIVNTPPAPKDSGRNMGMIVGIVVLLVVVYLFFVYGLPAMQNVKLGNPQINIPAKIEVTITQQK